MNIATSNAFNYIDYENKCGKFVFNMRLTVKPNMKYLEKYVITHIRKRKRGGRRERGSDSERAGRIEIIFAYVFSSAHSISQCRYWNNKSDYMETLPHHSRKTAAAPKKSNSKLLKRMHTSSWQRPDIRSVVCFSDCVAWKKNIGTIWSRFCSLFGCTHKPWQFNLFSTPRQTSYVCKASLWLRNKRNRKKTSQNKP